MNQCPSPHRKRGSLLLIPAYLMIRVIKEHPCIIEMLIELGSCDRTRNFDIWILSRRNSQTETYRFDHGIRTVEAKTNRIISNIPWINIMVRNTCKFPFAQVKCRVPSIELNCSPLKTTQACINSQTININMNKY
jgi:hypothetical protein